MLTSASADFLQTILFLPFLLYAYEKEEEMIIDSDQMTIDSDLELNKHAKHKLKCWVTFLAAKSIILLTSLWYLDWDWADHISILPPNSKALWREGAKKML